VSSEVVVIHQHWLSQRVPFTSSRSERCAAGSALHV